MELLSILLHKEKKSDGDDGTKRGHYDKNRDSNYSMAGDTTIKWKGSN